MLEKKPDALILNTHYTEGALIVRQARQLGYTGPIVAQGTNSLSSVHRAGREFGNRRRRLDGLPCDAESDPVVKADQKFKKAIGKEPLAVPHHHI